MSGRFARRTLLSMGPAAAAAGLSPAAGQSLTTVKSRIAAGRGRFTMPAHFGPSLLPDTSPTGGDALYGDVSQLTVAYLTDGEALKRYLPEPYELNGEPVVTVNYAMNRNVEWLAGAGYNIVGVYAPAKYTEKNGNEVTGAYALVLWENRTEPILTGREAQGVPKIFGDIEDVWILKDTWRTTLSHGGHKILDLAATGLKPVLPEQFLQFQAAYRNALMLGWKCIPNETMTGAILSYATAFPTTMSFREAWFGTGRLVWHEQSWYQNPTQAHIVAALRSLPVQQIRACFATKGSVTLLSSRVRRLD